MEKFSSITAVQDVKVLSNPPALYAPFPGFPSNFLKVPSLFLASLFQTLSWLDDMFIELYTPFWFKFNQYFKKILSFINKNCLRWNGIVFYDDTISHVSCDEILLVFLWNL